MEGSWRAKNNYYVLWIGCGVQRWIFWAQSRTNFLSFFLLSIFIFIGHSLSKLKKRQSLRLLGFSWVFWVFMGALFGRFSFFLSFVLWLSEQITIKKNYTTKKTVKLARIWAQKTHQKPRTLVLTHHLLVRFHWIFDMGRIFVLEGNLTLSFLCSSFRQFVYY